jgi:N-acetylglutamate synthase-like GNAT family acetyltransferase
MGVSPRWQGRSLGAQLYHEMERRVREEGMRMSFVDTARSNSGATNFFKRIGYGKPETEVWLSKMLQRTRKSKESLLATPHKRRVARRRRSAKNSS